MALKTIVKGNQSTNFIRMGELAEGETVAGYLLGTEEGKKFPGFLIKLLNKEGNVLTLTSNGNLRNVEEQVELGELTLNAYSEFTRVGSYTSKTQLDPKTKEYRIVPVFDIAQDQDDLVTDEQASEALAKDEANQSAAQEDAAPAKSSTTGKSKFANRSR